MKYRAWEHRKSIFEMHLFMLKFMSDVLGVLRRIMRPRLIQSILLLSNVFCQDIVTITL
jgi:hypothetical protein